jgi:hypothetical protein
MMRARAGERSRPGPGDGEVRTAALRVDAEVLSEVEHALSEPLLLGVPIGATLCSLLQIELLIGKARWDCRAVAADHVRWLRHRLLPERRPRPPRSPGQLGEHAGRILLTWLADHPNFTNLVVPLAEQLGGASCTVIGPLDTGGMPLDLLPSGVALLDWADLPRPASDRWRDEHRACAGAWHAAVAEVLDRHGVSRRVLPRIRTNLLCQARRIAACRELLEHLRPRAVVTEYDRNPYASCLVLAARSLGIPSFTMLHGVIASRFGYTPLVADRVFAWGDASRQRLIELGVEPGRVEVTGCQAVTRELPLDRPEARQRLGLPADRPVALLATTALREPARRDLARDLAAALPPSGGITAAARLHPSDHCRVYDQVRDEHPHLHLLRAADSSIDETLSAVDVVVCHSTAFGLDALVKRVPVIVLDSIAEPLIWGQELIDAAGCPRARSSEELAAAVVSLVRDPAARQALLERADRYISGVYAAVGDDAASRLADRIRQLIVEPVS